MIEIINAIQKTPIPILLIVSGLFVVVLAFSTKIGGVIEVSSEQRKWSIPTGLFLVTLGLILHLVSGVSNPSVNDLTKKKYWDDLHKVALKWDVTTAKEDLAELSKSNDKCVSEFAKRFQEELSSKGAEGFKSINPIKCSINKELNCKLPIQELDFSPNCS